MWKKGLNELNKEDPMRIFTGLFLAALLIAGGFATVLAATEYGPTEAKKEKGAEAKKSFDKPPPVGTEAICPVMGSKFKVTKDTTRSEYKGRHYVFCCSGCKPMFDADPGKYTK
jgi:YHS domain-containing protein